MMADTEIKQKGDEVETVEITHTDSLNNESEILNNLQTAHSTNLDSHMDKDCENDDNNTTKERMEKLESSSDYKNDTVDTSNVSADVHNFPDIAENITNKANIDLTEIVSEPESVPHDTEIVTANVTDNVTVVDEVWKDADSNKDMNALEPKIISVIENIAVVHEVGKDADNTKDMGVFKQKGDEVETVEITHTDSLNSESEILNNLQTAHSTNLDSHMDKDCENDDNNTTKERMEKLESSSDYENVDQKNNKTIVESNDQIQEDNKCYDKDYHIEMQEENNITQIHPDSTSKSIQKEEKTIMDTAMCDDLPEWDGYKQTTSKDKEDVYDYADTAEMVGVLGNDDSLQLVKEENVLEPITISVTENITEVQELGKDSNNTMDIEITKTDSLNSKFETLNNLQTSDAINLDSHTDKECKSDDNNVTKERMETLETSSHCKNKDQRIIQTTEESNNQMQEGNKCYDKDYHIEMQEEYDITQIHPDNTCKSLQNEEKTAMVTANVTNHVSEIDIVEKNAENVDQRNSEIIDEIKDQVQEGNKCYDQSYHTEKQEYDIIIINTENTVNVIQNDEKKAMDAVLCESLPESDWTQQPNEDNTNFDFKEVVSEQVTLDDGTEMVISDVSDNVTEINEFGKDVINVMDVLEPITISAIENAPQKNSETNGKSKDQMQEGNRYYDKDNSIEIQEYDITRIHPTIDIGDDLSEQDLNKTKTSEDKEDTHISGDAAEMVSENEDRLQLGNDIGTSNVSASIHNFSNSAENITHEGNTNTDVTKIVIEPVISCDNAEMVTTDVTDNVTEIGKDADNTKDIGDLEPITISDDDDNEISSCNIFEKNVPESKSVGSNSAVINLTKDTSNSTIVDITDDINNFEKMDITDDGNLNSKPSAENKKGTAVLSDNIKGAVNTNVKAVDTKVKAVDTKEKAVDTKVKAVETKVKAVDTKLKAVHTKMKAVDTKVKAVETKVKTVDTKVKAVHTKEKAAETKVKAVETKLKSVDTKVKAVETKVKDVETKVKAVDSKVKAVHTNVKPQIIFTKTGDLTHLVKAEILHCHLPKDVQEKISVKYIKDHFSRWKIPELHETWSLIKKYFATYSISQSRYYKDIVLQKNEVSANHPTKFYWLNRPRTNISEEKVCFKCGATNHSAKKCTQKVKDASSDGTHRKDACYVCGKGTHFARDCPQALKTSGEKMDITEKTKEVKELEVSKIDPVKESEVCKIDPVIEESIKTLMTNEFSEYTLIDSKSNALSVPPYLLDKWLLKNFFDVKKTCIILMKNLDPEDVLQPTVIEWAKKASNFCLNHGTQGKGVVMLQFKTAGECKLARDKLRNILKKDSEIVHPKKGDEDLVKVDLSLSITEELMEMRSVVLTVCERGSITDISKLVPDALHVMQIQHTPGEKLWNSDIFYVPKNMEKSFLVEYDCPFKAERVVEEELKINKQKIQIETLKDYKRRYHNEFWAFLFSKYSPDKEVKCLRCNVFGHLPPTCPRHNGRCPTCNQMGHIAKECHTLKSLQGVKCPRCNLIGHLPPTCPRNYCECPNCNQIGHIAKECHTFRTPQADFPTKVKFTVLSDKSRLNRCDGVRKLCLRVERKINSEYITVESKDEEVSSLITDIKDKVSIIDADSIRRCKYGVKFPEQEGMMTNHTWRMHKLRQKRKSLKIVEYESLPLILADNPSTSIKKSNSSPVKRDGSKGSKEEGDRKYSDQICPICKLKGHRAIKCNRKRLSCTRCNKIGHNDDKCNENLYPGKCGKCHKNGHQGSECPHNFEICVFCGVLGHTMENCNANIILESTSPQSKPKQELQKDVIIPKEPQSNLVTLKEVEQSNMPKAAENNLITLKEVEQSNIPKAAENNLITLKEVEQSNMPKAAENNLVTLKEVEQSNMPKAAENNLITLKEVEQSNMPKAAENNLITLTQVDQKADPLLVKEFQKLKQDYYGHWNIMVKKNQFCNENYTKIFFKMYGAVAETRPYEEYDLMFVSFMTRDVAERAVKDLWKKHLYDVKVATVNDDYRNTNPKAVTLEELEIMKMEIILKAGKQNLEESKQKAEKTYEKPVSTREKPCPSEEKNVNSFKKEIDKLEKDFYGDWNIYIKTNNLPRRDQRSKQFFSKYGFASEPRTYEKAKKAFIGFAKKQAAEAAIMDLYGNSNYEAKAATVNHKYRTTIPAAVTMEELEILQETLDGGNKKLKVQEDAISEELEKLRKDFYGTWNIYVKDKIHEGEKLDKNYFRKFDSVCDFRKYEIQKLLFVRFQTRLGAVTAVRSLWNSACCPRVAIPNQHYKRPDKHLLTAEEVNISLTGNIEGKTEGIPQNSNQNRGKFADMLYDVNTQPTQVQIVESKNKCVQPDISNDVRTVDHHKESKMDKNKKRGSQTSSKSNQKVVPKVKSSIDLEKDKAFEGQVFKCNKCQKSGHKTSECNANIQCHKCKKYGHKDRDCNSVKCARCNHYGHYSFDCQYYKLSGHPAESDSDDLKSIKSESANSFDNWSDFSEVKGSEFRNPSRNRKRVRSRSPSRSKFSRCRSLSISEQGSLTRQHKEGQDSKRYKPASVSRSRSRSRQNRYDQSKFSHSISRSPQRGVDRRKRSVSPLTRTRRNRSRSSSRGRSNTKRLKRSQETNIPYRSPSRERYRSSRISRSRSRSFERSSLEYRRSRRSRSRERLNLERLHSRSSYLDGSIDIGTSYYYSRSRGTTGVDYMDIIDLPDSGHRRTDLDRDRSFSRSPSFTRSLSRDWHDIRQTSDMSLETPDFYSHSRGNDFYPRSDIRDYTYRISRSPSPENNRTLSEMRGFRRKSKSPDLKYSNRQSTSTLAKESMESTYQESQIYRRSRSPSLNRMHHSPVRRSTERTYRSSTRRNRSRERSWSSDNSETRKSRRPTSLTERSYGSSARRRNRSREKSWSSDDSRKMERPIPRENISIEELISQAKVQTGRGSMHNTLASNKLPAIDRAAIESFERASQRIPRENEHRNFENVQESYQHIGQKPRSGEHTDDRNRLAFAQTREYETTSGTRKSVYKDDHDMAVRPKLSHSRSHSPAMVPGPNPESSTNSAVALANVLKGLQQVLDSKVDELQQIGDTKDSNIGHVMETISNIQSKLQTSPSVDDKTIPSVSNKTVQPKSILKNSSSHAGVTAQGTSPESVKSNPPQSYAVHYPVQQSWDQPSIIPQGTLQSQPGAVNYPHLTGGFPSNQGNDVNNPQGWRYYGGQTPSAYYTSAAWKK